MTAEEWLRHDAEDRKVTGEGAQMRRDAAAEITRLRATVEDLINALQKAWHDMEKDGDFRPGCPAIEDIKDALARAQAAKGEK